MLLPRAYAMPRAPASKSSTLGSQEDLRTAWNIRPVAAVFVPVPPRFEEPRTNGSLVMRARRSGGRRRCGVLSPVFFILSSFARASLVFVRRVVDGGRRGCNRGGRGRWGRAGCGLSALPRAVLLQLFLVLCPPGRLFFLAFPLFFLSRGALLLELMVGPFRRNHILRRSWLDQVDWRRSHSGQAPRLVRRSLWRRGGRRFYDWPRRSNRIWFCAHGGRRSRNGWRASNRRGS